MDKSSPIPIYYQLAEELRRKINEGVWQPGHCIDSERALSEEYNLSRMTIRQAIGELVKGGILTREKGKGTFVCEPKIKQRDIMSFTEVMEAAGIEFRTEIVAFDTVEADEEKYSLLKVDQIYKIQRLRIAKSVIIADETIYIPCGVLPNLDRRELEGSVYKILDSKGFAISKSESEVQAILINDYYRGLFRLNEDVPLLKVYSKNYNDEEKLIFIEESVYRSDKYILEINISRRNGIVR